MNFTYAQYQFDLSTDEIVGSSFLESTIRGGFGCLFKKTVCINRHVECQDCDFRQTCVYHYVFETLPPEGTKIMRKYNKVPHPFTFFLVSNDANRIVLELKLFGDSTKYLPYFIHSFIALGKRGLGKKHVKFELYRVRNMVSGKDIFKDGKMTSTGLNTTNFIIEDNEYQDVEKVNIYLKSPLAIRKEGKLLTKIVPETFIITLLRRIGNISYFHGGTELDIDYKSIKELSKTYKVTRDNTRAVSRSRFSTRQKKRINMIGLIGDFTLEGKLGPVYSYLKLGEIIHVGRGTSFGQGRYEMEVVEDE